MKAFNTKEESCFSIVYENLLLPTQEKRIVFHNGISLYESQNNFYPKYTFFDYYKDYYSNSFLEKHLIPHLIITACGNLCHLDKINYTEDTQNYLNSTGLEIYMYETIFLDTNKNKRKFVNFIPSKLPQAQIFDYIKPSAIGFESTNENISSLYCFEFEIIKKFAARNKLKKVTVYTGDYNVKKYFSSIYPELQISTHDVFLTSLFKESTEPVTSYEYDTKSLIPSNDTILYKFWCGNRRYDGYRHLTVAYLIDKLSLCSIQNKIEESPFITFDTRKNKSTPLWGELKNYLWFNFESWKIKYPAIYHQIQNQLEVMPSTISIDENIESTTALESLPIPKESYQKCFCAVITEARFAYPLGQFSEKTLNAIKTYRPFILVAPPHTLSYLQSYGIKTFSDFWDESYDREENHEKRLIKIFQVIDYIDNFSINDLKELYTKLEPILDHNYRIIYNIKKSKYNGRIL